MTLVLLAAGRGTRFGGAKQLAEVGPNGGTVTDAMLERAAAAGVDHAVIVVSPELEDAMRAHFSARQAPMGVDFACQQNHRGTADALLAARALVDNWCIVLNADDVYPASAFAMLTHHAREGPDTEHAMVAFRVDRTFANTRPGSRALVGRDADDRLVSIEEGRVTVEEHGYHFESVTDSHALAADELVSMNIWMFRPQFFDDVAQLVGAHDDAGEIYLPDAVAHSLRRGGIVRVFATDDRCVELTYPEDVAAVRAALSQ